MIWLLYFPLMVIIMVICYITNPIVVLFADEVGELHGFWHYWQTWDDTLDSKYMMKTVIPEKFYGKLLDYDWESKYEWYQDTVTLANTKGVIDKVRLRPGATFSVKEKIQRYFCRVLWLTRNCAYGFAKDMFGISGSLKDLKVIRKEVENPSDEFVFIWDEKQNILTRPWTCRFYKKIFEGFYVTGYIGWKIPYWREDDGDYHCMIANRVVPRFKENS